MHNVVMAVEGPEGAARQALFEAVDKVYVQGLVGQPLPEVEASKHGPSRNSQVASTGK